MTLSASTQEPIGGVDSDPPVANAHVPDDHLEHLGMLDQPGLWSRLTESIQSGALLPDLDPRSLKSREWKAAGSLALAAHILAFGALMWLGWHTLTTGESEPNLALVSPVFEVAETKQAHGDGGNDAGGGGEAGGGSAGNESTPASAGSPPPMRTHPPMVAPLRPPPLKPPVLAVDPSIMGTLNTPSPESPLGAPDMPPPPVPSSGTGGGDGLGDGSGKGVGPGSGDGAGPGNGKQGTGVNNSTGPTGPSVNGDPGTGRSGDPSAPKITRGPRFSIKVKAKPTARMLESGTAGTVRLKVTVGARGEIVGVSPVQPLPNGGTQAAIEALYKCTFLPGLEAGVPVQQTVIVTMEFTRN